MCESSGRSESRSGPRHSRANGELSGQAGRKGVLFWDNPVLPAKPAAFFQRVSKRGNPARQRGPLAGKALGPGADAKHGKVADFLCKWLACVFGAVEVSSAASPLAQHGIGTARTDTQRIPAAAVCRASAGKGTGLPSCKGICLYRGSCAGPAPGHCGSCSGGTAAAAQAVGQPASQLVR